MFILEAIAAFGNWFWGLPILFLIVGGGIYITIRLGFVQFRKFGYICSQTFGKMFAKAGDGEVSSFSAACGALASSIGASNIVGVPAAVVMGGPGAVFWIWLIALIGCGTKYCEIALAIKYREKNEAGEWVGGAAYYLRALGGGIGKFLGGWYAIGLMIELIPSLCTQALSATSQFIILGVDQKISGAILGILVAVIIAGGVNRVLKITDIMVPVMAILYMAGALVIIIMNAGQILPALGSIFVYAFTPHAAIGGFAGSTIALALRWGAARGVYSNEAGFGTAPTAHATASVDHPIRQACWGVFEVTVDTLIVCTVTALLTLTTGMWTTADYDTGAIAQAAFHNAFGTFGDYFVAISVFLFVFSTLIACCMFGWKQAEYLFGLKFSKIWRYIYPLFMIIAASGLDLTMMYMVTDGFLAAIMTPNMIGLIIMVPQVAKLQKEYFNTPGKYYLADKEAKKAKKAAK
ncbi:amino acid carrier protein [Casaltella massiliensis]|nr:amino acid carrier protein [Casaltella massiliensis]